MILAQNPAQETGKTQATSTSQATDVNAESQEKLFLAIDAEWDSRYNLDLALSLSIQNGSRCIVLNENIQEFLDFDVYQRIKKASLQWGEDRGVMVLWMPFSDDADYVNYFLDEVGVEQKDVHIRMFSSPKDLSIGFGYDNLKEHYRANSKYGIQQRRNVVAHNLPIDNRRFSIMDLKGLIPVGGLKALAESVGYTMTSKSDMDVYKSRMLDGLVEETEKFLDYALADAVDLHEIHDRFNTYVRTEVCKNVLGVEFEGDIPMTTGSLVARVFQQWLHNRPTHKSAFEFAIRKLGILDTSGRNYRKNLKVYNQLIGSINSVADLDTNPKASEDIAALDFRSKGYSQASVHELARRSTSGAFNALVHGGRCINEFPYAYSLNCAGADIDLRSCYGTSLKEFIFPIGLPTVWGGTELQDSPTLGQWLSKNEKDLHPGLWQVVVSGDLPFNQDLIYSKLVDLDQIHAAAYGGWEKDESQCKSDEIRDNDLKHIPGLFTLIFSHIENGVITADLLEAIRKISTPNELSAWMRLEVVCASGYKLSDQVADIDEWSELVLADTGRFEAVDFNDSLIKDERTKKWVGIPIGDFITPLVNKRLEIKSLAKSNKDLLSLDSLLKLFINTLYGTLASIYFEIGNSVVANNITARARLGSWMLSKALWTWQSITDGGCYSLMKIPFLTKEGKGDHTPGLMFFLIVGNGSIEEEKIELLGLWVVLIGILGSTGV